MVTRRAGEIYRQLGLLERMEAGWLRCPANFLSVWMRDGLAGELLGATPFADDDKRFSPANPFAAPNPPQKRCY